MEKYLKSYVVQLKNGNTINPWEALDVDPDDVECLLPRADYVNAAVYKVYSAYRCLLPLLSGLLKSKNREGAKKSYVFAYDTYIEFHNAVISMKKNEEFLTQVLLTDNVDLIFDLYHGEYLMRRVHKFVDPKGKEFGSFMTPLPLVELDLSVSGLTWLEKKLLKSMLIDPKILKKVKMFLRVFRIAFQYKKHPGVLLDPLFMGVRYSAPLTEDDISQIVIERMNNG